MPYWIYGQRKTDEEVEFDCALRIIPGISDGSSDDYPSDKFLVRRIGALFSTKAAQTPSPGESEVMSCPTISFDWLL